MKRNLFFLALLLNVVLSFNAKAQSGANDPTFNPTDQGFGYGDAADNIINTIAIQSDGKIIIGGGFTSYNGTSRNRIARLNTDGSLDTTFNPGTGANSEVYAVAIQTDGKIIIGGGFTSYDGIAINRIARLNADGSLDATFNPGTGANDDVQTIAIQSDGKIIIGGLFTSYDGTARNYIAHLNTNGSLDATFNSGGTGANDVVQTIAIQSDGKIIIGGWFTSYNGTTRNYIARLNSDGSLDATFNPGTGANGFVHTIAIQSDGKIIIGGWFTSYNGTTRNYIARLNTNGMLDATFNQGTGANGLVQTIALQSDGKIIIGGGFTSYNGTLCNSITRLNSNGSLDATFNTGTGSNSYINTIAIQIDGKIIIGGWFTSYNGTSCNYIAHLNADGSLDATFNPGTGANGFVQTIALQSDGKIIIGGGFTSYNGTLCNYITRLNADGSLDATFNPGAGANDLVKTVAIQSDGKIIIGGWFTSYNGTTRNHIVRMNVDGSLDATFNPGTGANDVVEVIALQSDGKIIIGGWFTSYNGTTRNRLVRLNFDGSLDATFNPGTGANGVVHTIAIQSDGKIIIGGWFTTYNGISRNRIARLNSDGSLDATFNPGTGANYEVSAIVIQSDGKIIIGGWFTSYNGTTRNRIVRLNDDGSLDATFNPGTGANDFVQTVAIPSDGKIIIGGRLTSYDGITINRIARLNSDGSLDATFNPGTGANGVVLATAIQSDGKIIIGGRFTSYNEIGRNRVTRIINCINLAATASSNSPLCSGAMLNLTSLPNGMASYNWSGPGGWTTNVQNPILAGMTQAQAGLYTVTVTDVNGCTETASANVLVNASPTAAAASNSPLCAGATLNLTSLPNSMASYYWSGPGGWTSYVQNPSLVNITQAQAGVYIVIVTDVNGCIGIAHHSVTVDLPPQADFVAYNISGGTYGFTDMSQNATSLLWDFGDGNISNVQNPLHTYTASGLYTVMLITSNACGSDTAIQDINVIISNIVSTNANLNIKAYPNPNNGIFFMNLNANYTGNVEMEVYGIDGKKVYAKSWDKNTTEQTMPVNLKSLSNGMYRILLRVGEDLLQTTIVIYQL